MIGPQLSRVAVYVRPGPTDMRKAINGLSIIVAEQMDGDPLCGALYVFCNRDRRILKGLWWDRNGFCLFHKRLERDRFPWPASEEAAREITAGQLRMLLDGIDFWRAHRARVYESVS